MRTTISTPCLRTLYVLVWFFPCWAQAQETPNLIGEIQSIARTEGYVPAIRKLDKEISKNDTIKTELLVLKAELRLNNQQTNEAIDIYLKLIKEQPKNLIYRNNLAVIYAKQGKLVEAERLILLGIKQHPEFSTLYSNLLTMKSQQAALALQMALDPNKAQNPRALLSAIHSINGNDVKAPEYEPPIAQIAPPTKASAIAEPPVIKPPTPTRNEVLMVNRSAVEPKLSPTPSAEDQQILAFAQGWAMAWSSGDAERYLSYYSEQFLPESKTSFTTWAAQRRQRITPDQGIQVEIEETQVVLRTDESAEIRFRQLYQSKTLKARSNKLLTLSWQNGQWKIVRERVVTR